MVSTQADKILYVYKELSENSVLTSAELIPTVKHGIKVESVWSQRNLEMRKKQQFIRDFSLDSKLELLAESFPSDITSEILKTTSNDGKVKAILRDVADGGKFKQFIEIWDSNHLMKSYDVSKSDVHGDVYSEPTFGAFELSPENKRLLYITEKKLKKSKPFYEQKSGNDKKCGNEEPTRGAEYIFKPDWGEQFVSKHRSAVVVLNIKEDSIVPLDSIPDDYFPGQVIWAPNGVDIVGVAHKLYPRYPCNRESYIFHLQDNIFRTLTAETTLCRSPRFSHDGKHLIWLERTISQARNHVQRLMHLKWNALGTVARITTTSTICYTVQDVMIISKNKKFYGLYNLRLPKRCWSEDSKYIFFSTLQRSEIKSYMSNLDTKLITEIDNADRGCLTILDVSKNYIAFSKSSPIQPSQLVIGKFDSHASDIDKLVLKYCTTPFTAIKKYNLMYENVEFVYDNNDTVKDFNFTYLGKQDESEKSMPLIVIVHGGPHLVSSNEFNLSHAVLASLGISKILHIYFYEARICVREKVREPINQYLYFKGKGVSIGFGVLLINYRGSAGMGGKNVEYILGKVGESDVLDCMTAINTALKMYTWLDPRKISLSGGSHGAFINAHLSWQYPDMFKSVVMRNPVIDIATLFSTSDIPDWCTSVLGNAAMGTLPETIHAFNYSELLKRMLNLSPILHVDKVKAATLITLGSNDLRVPPSQGKLWYYHLSTNNVPAKLYMYDDNHSLLKDEVEIDFFMNTVLWILKHQGQD